MPARLGIPLAILLCSCLAACAPADGNGRVRLSADAADWPYAPASIRVHPISRIKMDRESGTAVVQARIELLDPDGFSTRGLGSLTLLLSGQSENGIMLMSQTEWKCDLNDLKTNRKYYDEVTRTYQVTLDLSPRMGVPWEPRLRAMLVTPDGRTLSDTSGIRFTRTAPEQPPTASSDEDVDAADQP